MRYVNGSSFNFKQIWFSLSAFVLLSTAPGCFSAAVTWTPTGLKLAFLSPLTGPYTVTSQNSLQIIQVAVVNGTGATVTTSGPYQISLAMFSDSSCKTAYTTGGTSNSVGTPTATQNGIASINTSGGNNSPQGNIYIQASSAGITPACSSAITFPLGALLVSQIEMIDYGVASATGTAIPYAGSQTTLDTGAYDNAFYFFEIVALNTDTSAHNVSLMSGGTILATISVPGSEPLTRNRVSFAPVSGYNTYQIQLDATSSANLLEVTAARMVVQQTGATKTKLYIPLVSGTYNAYATSASGSSGAVLASSSSILTAGVGQYFKFQTIWNKNSGTYSTLASPNPWSLEVVMAAANASNPATATLISTGGTVVSSSTVTTAQTTPTLVTATFPDFAAGNAYELTTYSGSSSNPAYVYRAGLWVTLSNISSAEIYNRLFSAYQNATGPFTSDAMRNYIDLSLFSNPTVFFETVSGASMTFIDLSVLDCGTADSGTTGCSTVTNSAINITTAGNPATYRTSLSLPLTNGDRYIFTGTGSSGMATEAVSFLVIQIP